MWILTGKLRMKIRHINFILSLIVFFNFFFVIHQAQSKTPNRADVLLEEADKCRKSLYRSAKKKKYRHNWLRCVKRYKKIYKRYPKKDPAVWAMYHSARMYAGLYSYSKRSKDLDEALRLYRKLADGYKQHRLADDAQYRIGVIYYKYKKNYTQAYLEFLKVEIRFPSGDMRLRAKKMLDELSITLSKKNEKSSKNSAVKKIVAVKDIRYWSTRNYTRVVIDLEGSTPYKFHLLKADPTLKKPQRLYIDLKHAVIASEIDKQFTIDDGLLQRVRAGQNTKDTVRVVLDIESISSHKVFRLHDPFRVVVDARKAEKKEVKGKTQKLPKKRARIKKGKRSGVKDKSVSLARQLGLNVERIVIDPGHGGKDPGCINAGGIREKDIVLSLAKMLARKIKNDIGCDVFFTRDKDVFIPLERRTAIANIKKADLFISLHVNAHKSRKIWGVETYYLNMATDENAVMVAARENATSERNISDLQSILNDLMLNTKIHESNRLAHQVQGGIISRIQHKYKTVRSLGVKQAPFYVLIGAEMPAVLVEVGFITNATERKRLQSKTYQGKIVEGICDGIKDYIKSINQTARVYM
jgi:N-acetylmuramoyl-L-alanine amidase